MSRTISAQRTRWTTPALAAAARRVVALVAGACSSVAGVGAAPSPENGAGTDASAAASLALESKRTTVRKLACDARVPPDFVLAVLDKESGFDNAMRGSMGEIGASQILPSTALALGLDVRRLRAEFAYNVQAGIAILQNLLSAARGDQRKALCHYRAGPMWFRLPPRAQRHVRAYVSSVVEIMKTRYAGVSCP